MAESRQTRHSISPGQDAVFRAQIAHLYRQLPSFLGYSLLTSLAMALMLRNAIAAPYLAAWFGAIVFFILMRLALFYYYYTSSENRSTRFWAYSYVVLAAISGFVWGAAGIVLFAPDNLELQALVVLALAGMGAGSASVLPMYLPAFYSYLPLSLIPIGTQMFLQQQGDFHFFMGIFVFIFLFGVLGFGTAIGAALRSALVSRFENIDLVAALEKQKAELERANLAKSKFLAAASHDLRQPLHALSLFSELLDKQASDRQTRELASSISGSVSVLERLFSALLDISRIDAGVLKPDIEMFQVRNVVEQVFLDSLPKANAKGVQLFVDCGDEYTESDPTLLERIVRNLVSNAVRYTRKGNVTIRCRRISGSLQLSVIDTGIGIADSQKDYIFEEFTQLDNPERDQAKGLGLGLSIVRRLSQLLGHQLELHSEPGVGSRFSLTLPYRDKPFFRLEKRQQAVPRPGEPLSLSVLIVDDDPAILEGTRQLLESWGCEVRTAKTADEAAKTAFRMERLDALITDFRLPDEARGTQVVETVREVCGRKVPSLLITGDLEPARLREAHALSLELLHKPVKPARLRAWLQKVSVSA